LTGKFCWLGQVLGPGPAGPPDEALKADQWDFGLSQSYLKELDERETDAGKGWKRLY